MDTATLEPIRSSPIGRVQPVIGLTLAAHPDPARIGERVWLADDRPGRSLAIGRHEPVFATVAGSDTGPIDDRYVSRRPLVIRPGAAGSVTVDADGCGSSVRVDEQPLTGAIEIDAARIDVGVVIELADRVVLLLHRFHPRWSEAQPEDLGLVGHSDAVARLRREIMQVADLDIPVLIRGETGTGKELVAQAIHAASRRSGRPCLSVNMGALSASTAAAELFGHARGAFTGADRARSGLFREADGGTLFLDEIAEAATEVQVLLLRTLETGEVRALGETGARPVDVRVLAATDADLDAAVATGRFREPLLHRLQGSIIHLPPLRARRDDIPRLLVHFLRAMLAEVGEPAWLDGAAPADRPWLTARVVERLMMHDWPGNVRELRNVARQLVVSSRGGDELSLRPSTDRLLTEGMVPDAAPDPVPVDPGEIDDARLIATLRQHRWRIHAAAQALGLSRQALYRRIDRSPLIRKAGDLPRDEIQRALVEAGGRPDGAAMRLEVSPRGLRLRMTELGL